MPSPVAMIRDAVALAVQAPIRAANARGPRGPVGPLGASSRSPWVLFR
jgi:hypothetical protein